MIRRNWQEDESDKPAQKKNSPETEIASARPGKWMTYRKEGRFLRVENRKEGRFKKTLHTVLP